MKGGPKSSLRLFLHRALQLNKTKQNYRHFGVQIVFLRFGIDIHFENCF